MAHDYGYDPAKDTCPPQHGPVYPCGEPCCYGIGPGGRSTNIENNEKGILDNGVLTIAQKISTGYMSSSHDSHRQGIYTTNSVGDND